MIYRVSLITLYFLFESLRYGPQPEKDHERITKQRATGAGPNMPLTQETGLSIIASVVGVSGLTASAFETKYNILVLWSFTSRKKN